MRVGFQIPNQAVPVEGGVALPYNFDFTAVTTVRGDLALEQQQGVIAFVQSIFIDNRFNANPFIINFSGTNYTIQCRAGRQGIFPVIASMGNLAFAANSQTGGGAAAGLIVPTLMMNTAINFFTWDI